MPTPAFTFSAALPCSAFTARRATPRPVTPWQPSAPPRPAPLMTSAEIIRQDTNPQPEAQPDTPPPPPKPTPREQPPFISATPLIAALYAILSGRTKPTVALTPLLEANCIWDTPLFTTRRATDAAANFASFLSFAMQPTIRAHALTNTPHGYAFTWTVSYTYPLPWRPRVAVSGRTVVTLTDAGTAATVTDSWYVPPTNIIQQTLPTLPDIIWLWPAPHAETDRGCRRLLRRTKHYQIIQHAAREEFRIRADLDRAEQRLVWATPVLPEQIFTGGLRRKEQYSTVSPISLRKLPGDTFQWAVPVPGTLLGSSDVLVQQPVEPGAEIFDVPESVMAIFRFRGYATRDVVLTNLAKFKKRLVADGIFESMGDVREEDVWVRVYDSKVGFNTKGMLSMAMYGSSKGVPRVNEIAIDLSGTEVAKTLLADL